MELQQHIGHPHPLVFNEETSNQSKVTFHCSGCEEKVLGPSFSCAKCGFFLHKDCAEAPMEIEHPFHRHHPLLLRPPSPHEEETAYCEFCYRSTGKGFSYHCSFCKIAFHINCTLLARHTAGNFIEILHDAHQHPLVLIDNHNHNYVLKYRVCSGCSSRLVDASYVCFDCKIFFHKKCVELPIEISHPCHRKHQLILEFATTRRLCYLCQSEHRGLFYGCSICNLDIHSECAWPPPVIEDKSHEHPFTLLLRPNSFTCDACGTHGDNVCYICSICNIQVHKDCISLPRFIRINLHRHPISRNFFFCIHRRDSRTWDCRICYKKVNTEHGSYYCSQPDCDFIIHVKCAIEHEDLYDVIELENLYEIEEFDFLPDESRNLIIRIISEIKVGEDVVAAEIIHSSHEHNLTFSNEIKDNKHCNGCVLPIFSSFYYCSRCDFFLHKACAELPRKSRLWFAARPFILHTNGIFECNLCRYECSGFSYKLDDDIELCLRCAALSHSFTYQAHEPHYLFFDKNCESQCSACGSDTDVFCRCKDCDFALDPSCVTLPHTAWHKCDKHSLTLTYRDYNDYPLQHYCDICEKRRDPKHWFYHCEVCDNAMHPKCVLGRYPFVKLGSKYTYENHTHPLAFVQKIYYYPLCVECGEPCQDLTLECVEHDCNFVTHWKCIDPFSHGDTSGDNDSGSE